MSLFGQNLQQHRWQNRLLIIVDHSKKSDKRLKQSALLKKEKAGLLERKLLVYHFTKEEYQKGVTTDKNWLPVQHKLNFLPKNNSFSIYLIGLDGGIKMGKNEIVEPATIFALIDGMPMRRAELKGY